MSSKLKLSNQERRAKRYREKNAPLLAEAGRRTIWRSIISNDNRGLNANELWEIKKEELRITE